MQQGPIYCYFHNNPKCSRTFIVELYSCADRDCFALFLLFWTIFDSFLVYESTGHSLGYVFDSFCLFLVRLSGGFLWI